MYRFSSRKGFLFHPVPQKEVNDEKVVSDYTIEDRPECHLYEVGLVVAEDAASTDNKYKYFRDKMTKREKDFREEVKKKIWVIFEFPAKIVYINIKFNLINHYCYVSEANS